MSASARNTAAPIPGAIHRDWTHNSPPTAASSRPRNCARSSKRSASIRESEIIPYCQGGYRSANAYIALRLAGYPRVRNYLGSWGEWGNRDELPIEHPRRKPVGR